MGRAEMRPFRPAFMTMAVSGSYRSRPGGFLGWSRGGARKPSEFRLDRVNASFFLTFGKHVSTYQDQSIEEFGVAEFETRRGDLTASGGSEKALSEAAAQPAQRTKEGDEKTLGFGSLSY
ncbi:MAG: hypothetical protein JO175_11100 [Candidatus Eremiobacteraeota bacterium]|nr:hypothetical protein [Candidatus Eremiobacteraeota bacterium]